MKGLKKLGSLFLVAIFLLVGIANVKAYDYNTITTDNNNIVMNFLGVDPNEVGDYISVKGDLKSDTAKVSLQFIGLDKATFEDIQNKYAAYEAAKGTTGETAAFETYTQAVPAPDETKWTQLTLSKTTETANRYNAKVDETKEYFVAWAKVEVGTTVKYGYDVNCLAHIPRYCEVYNNKYYNKEGKEVSKEAYYKDCLTCEKVGDDYINSKGEIVTEAEYKKDCFPNCKVKDGKYYDNDGNEITKSQYDKLCGNPKTGNQTFYMYGIATVGIAFVLYMFTRKIRKFSK